jgi:hypothetical protein
MDKMNSAIIIITVKFFQKNRLIYKRARSIEDRLQKVILSLLFPLFYSFNRDVIFIMIDVTQGKSIKLCYNS